MVGLLIRPLDSTIVVWLDDKSVSGYQPMKDKNLCLSILRLVHKAEIELPGYPILKLCIYTYPVL